jgi:hypothetical protein
VLLSLTSVIVDFHRGDYLAPDFVDYVISDQEQNEQLTSHNQPNN